MAWHFWLFLKVCPRRVSTEVTICSGNCPPIHRSRFQTTRYPTRHCFRGPQFASQVWRELCKSVGSTALRCVTVHHPVSWSTPHSMHWVCAQLTHLFIHWHVSFHVSQLPTPSFFPSKWRKWLADAHRSPLSRIALDRWFCFLPVIFRWSSNHVCCLPTRLATLKSSRSSTPLLSSYSSQSLWRFVPPSLYSSWNLSARVSWADSRPPTLPDQWQLPCLHSFQDSGCLPQKAWIPVSHGLGGLQSRGTVLDPVGAHFRWLTHHSSSASSLTSQPASLTASLDFFPYSMDPWTAPLSK